MSNQISFEQAINNWNNIDWINDVVHILMDGDFTGYEYNGTSYLISPWYDDWHGFTGRLAISYNQVDDNLLINVVEDQNVCSSTDDIRGINWYNRIEYDDDIVNLEDIIDLAGQCHSCGEYVGVNNLYHNPCGVNQYGHLMFKICSYCNVNSERSHA